MAPEGVECLVGLTRHPRFGPLVTFGLGGVLVEHHAAVSHALAPLSTGDARALVRAAGVDSLLEGVRGGDAVDADALSDALVRLSWLAVDAPALAEFEVNPLLVTSEGVLVLDFHGRLETARDDGAAGTDVPAR
ncbi:acetate--CoA ligase family protein [Natrononativus amylolyticus]|uniref:acetate--CoA ligase family protein n=1 Tax=Natrononativus amylolyticus TaxID=2963434 RepID=UPI0020CE5C83|nr:acetate--CoA ligase family protein [Natrononativus amylolyticus]